MDHRTDRHADGSSSLLSGCLTWLRLCCASNDAPPDAAADDRIPAPDTPMAASIDRSIRAPASRRPIVVRPFRVRAISVVRGSSDAAPLPSTSSGPAASGGAVLSSSMPTQILRPPPGFLQLHPAIFRSCRRFIRAQLRSLARAILCLS
jgi:hypothetical protein